MASLAMLRPIPPCLTLRSCVQCPPRGRARPNAPPPSTHTGQGAVVGVTDFVLRRLRSFQADSVTPCTVMEISRATLDVMVAEVPAVATALQVSAGAGG